MAFIEHCPSDTGFVMVGQGSFTTSSSTSQSQCWFSRFDKNGNVLFSRFIDILASQTGAIPLANRNGNFTCVKRNAAGDFYFTTTGISYIGSKFHGYTPANSTLSTYGLAGDAGVAKFDANFNLLFFKAYNTFVSSILNPNGFSWLNTCPPKVFPTSDNGAVVYGNSGDSVVYLNPAPTHSPHIFLFKIDANGNLQWFKKYLDVSLRQGNANDVIQTPDGGYLLSGTHFLSPTVNQAVLIKTDAFGNIQWSKLYGTNNIEFMKILPLSNAYIILGQTISGTIGGQAWNKIITKVDLNGTVLWCKQLHNQIVPGSYDFVLDGLIDSNGHIVLAGTSANGSFTVNRLDLIKLDTALGNLINTKNYSLTNNALGYFNIIEPVKGVYRVGGWYYNSSFTSSSSFQLTVDDSLSNTCELLATQDVNNYPLSEVVHNPIVLSNGYEWVVNLQVVNEAVPQSNSCQTFISTSQNNNLCHNGNSGSATINYSGLRPASYQWSPVTSTLNSVTGLAAGTYTCIVTDPLNNKYTYVFNITQPSAITTAVTTTQSSCGGSSGTALVNSAGGNPAYTYLWSNNQTNALASGLSSGLYTVTVADALGCSIIQTATVTNSGGPTVSIMGNTVTCGLANGTLSAITGGGTTPYTYLWNSGQTNSFLTGLNAGVYSLTVTDQFGCLAIQTNTLVSIPPPLLLINASSETCGKTNGIATAAINGGVFPLSYYWSNSQTSSSATGLSAGVYSVTVSDGSGCIVSNTVSITNVSGPSVNLNSSSSVCGKNTGTAMVSTLAGTAPFTYLWSNNQTSSAISGLSSGNYSVSVTDSNGCIVTQTVNVTTIPISVNVFFANETCQMANGTATVTANGISPYHYLWSNGATSSSVSMLSQGIYSVTVTDFNSCVQSTTVAINNMGGLNANAGNDTTIFNGGSALLNGMGGGSYVWSPGNTLSCTACNNPIASPTKTTTYYLVVTDNNGCTSIDSVVVTVIPEIICGNVYIPNAFSPNNDTQNDNLCIFINCVKTMNLSIYSRWGEKVFETRDPSICWDGYYKGKLLNTDVFTYTFFATLVDDSEINKKGNISLVK